MRLDKYIANSGFATRSEIKKIIKSGKVSVDGIVAKSGDIKIDENIANVEVDGQVIKYSEFVYLMMNKPQGYVSATEDKHYKTVIEFIPEEYQHYNAFPVGRLDIDTEGLLILSNDGQFAHNVITPKKNIYKKYYAELSDNAEEKDITEFKSGMQFKEFTAKSAVLEITDNPKNVFISIAEGKYHQVKRMCERIGKTVMYLKRVKIGRLELDKNLELGEVRELTSDEVQSIFKSDI